MRCGTLIGPIANTLLLGVDVAMIVLPILGPVMEHRWRVLAVTMALIWMVCGMVATVARAHGHVTPRA
jgi:hypothetical protein